MKALVGARVDNDTVAALKRKIALNGQEVITVVNVGSFESKFLFDTTHCSSTGSRHHRTQRPPGSQNSDCSKNCSLDPGELRVS